MTALPETPGPTSHSFFSQRLRLHYVDYGTAGKPLLVLVHGGRDHARSWDYVAAPLRRDYHVIAPDLRGHGDSAWAIGSQYSMPDYILDLAQLLRHVGERPVILLGHSLGGAIVLQYAGIYPDAVTAVIAIEGLGPPPQMIVDRPVEQRMDEWIQTMQSLAMRQPRRYRSLAEAEARMREANPHLSDTMARHLTVHGTMRMEDGTYVWKFDNYVRAWPPHRYDREAVARLWSRITCPVLLVRGRDSWASNPVEDGRASHFRNYRYADIEGAGHWVHHDQYDVFMNHVTAFLSEVAR
ncbi:MAG: alpha/beta hydrolase [Deltaproteobacteria bacterium]|nr:MAG: alpha/beta hydrolase [Deltaproteobacteria bacterium]